MATKQLSRVIDTLRSAALPQEGPGLSDGQLLESYVRSREEGAFAALVHRHGPMVWGVCRRVLDSHQDAEDAFQATFLVLVRKAGAVTPREMVANWLYGVAHQTALKARANTARRRGREKQVTAMPERALEQQQLWDDMRGLLDRELSRLPEKYRALIVLCDLQGKTRKAAAQHFRLPEGTVASRLATARSLLAKRLTRSGLTLSAGTLAALLSQNLALGGTPPASLACATIKAATLFAAGQAAATGAISAKAALLAEGVLKTMLLTKLKYIAGLLLIIAALGGGAAALTQHVWAEKPDLPGPESKRPAPKQAAADNQAGQEAALQKAQAQQADKEKKNVEPLPTEVSGLVKEVDAQKQTLTVSHRAGETTFSVPTDAKIEIDGKPGKLTGMAVGASIRLRQFLDPTTARSIQAEGRWLSGTLKAVDVGNSTITFDEHAHNGAAGKTFNVPKDLAISIDGKSGKLSGLPAGASVNVQLFADQTTVRSCSAEGSQINGQVKAVNLEKRTITVNDATYLVAQDAHIGIDHKPGKLEGIPAGANVSLNLTVDQKTVLRISANGPSDFGTVKSVDAVNNTITLTGGPPDDRTYQVPPDAPIHIDGKPGKLADIPVGTNMHALNVRVDQKTVASINAVGPGYHHVGVKAVDPENNTITIDDKAPAQIAGKTFAVAADANIEIDGKPGKLAGIPAGAFVNLGLSVDSKTARNLQAEGTSFGGCGGSELSAVDAANNSITFSDKGAADVVGKTFNVLKDAWIQIDAYPGKLAGIPAGSYVNITLTVDQQYVRSIWAVGPPVPGTGTVKAVDAAKRTITVDDTTYPVAKNANIIIDNRGGLGAIPVGATVSLRLCVDQKTLGTINVLNGK
jgi:RNA polymerase sigma factor (sigma-70 family)